MGKTDANGRDFMFLRQQDALYKVVVQDYLTIKYTSGLFKLNGQSFTITISESGLSEILDAYDSISFQLTYDNNTDNATLTFVSPSSNENVCMRITQFTGTRSNVTYDACIKGTAGTITQNLPDENGTYVISYYVHGSPEYISKNLFVVKQGTILSNVLGLDQLWISFLIIFVFAFMGLVTPTGPIIMGLVALFLVWLLGLLTIPTAAVFGLAIGAGLIVARLRS